MYSAYQLSWPGGSLFLLITLIYAIFQYIIDNFRNESSDYLGFTGIATFLVSVVLIFPFVHPDMGFSLYYYSWFHVVMHLEQWQVLQLLVFLKGSSK